jgi:hypothetical protein
MHQANTSCKWTYNLESNGSVPLAAYSYLMMLF